MIGLLLVALQLTPGPQLPPTPLYSFAADPYIMSEDGCIVDEYGYWVIAEDDTIAFSARSCGDAVRNVSRLDPLIKTYWSGRPVKRYRL